MISKDLWHLPEVCKCPVRHVENRPKRSFFLFSKKNVKYIFSNYGLIGAKKLLKLPTLSNLQTLLKLYNPNFMKCE